MHIVDIISSFSLQYCICVQLSINQKLLINLISISSAAAQPVESPVLINTTYLRVVVISNGLLCGTYYLKYNPDTIHPSVPQ